MTAPAKRVVRSDLWIDAAFDERLRREPGVSLAVFPARGDPAAAWDLLAGGARLPRRRRPRTNCRASGSCTRTCSPAAPTCCACRPAAPATTRWTWPRAPPPASPWSTRPAATRPRWPSTRWRMMLGAVAPHGGERPPHAARNRLHARGRDGPRDPRQDAGPGGHRAHRHAGCGPGQRLRHGGDRDRSAADRRGDRAPRRACRAAAGPAGASRLRLAALPARCRAR